MSFIEHFHNDLPYGLIICVQWQLSVNWFRGFRKLVFHDISNNDASSGGFNRFCKYFQDASRLGKLLPAELRPAVSRPWLRSKLQGKCSQPAEKAVASWAQPGQASCEGISWLELNTMHRLHNYQQWWTGAITNVTDTGKMNNWKVTLSLFFKKW